MSSIPQELVDYLVVLISPPEPYGQALYLSELAEVDWGSIANWADDSVTGVIAKGTPTQGQSEELLRILKPGAHLCLIAPDDQPTGHTGTCRIEDAGFEIRDAILLVREPGKFHYVAKPARSERDAGCGHLPAKTGHEAVERKEGTAGLNNPRAGAGRTATTVRNFHPTCKPINIMARLLEDVPEGYTVCDPFVGSGTTGIAAVKTGHSFIGIEREEEYLNIADARVRHWDAEWWRGREIESDVDSRQEGDGGDAELGDLMGFLLGGGDEA